MTPAAFVPLVVRRALDEARGATPGRGRAPEAVRRAATAAVMVIGARATALACPACFGAEETSMIDGARLGILVMLGITFAVQGAFLGFFLYLRRRAKRVAESDLDSEWSQLQRGSSTS